MSQRQEAAQEGIKSVRQGIFVNLFLAIVKAVVGIVGNSFALVADAIESATDVLSSLIVLLGLRMASKAPDEDHPYGHGRVETLTAIIVAGTLILAAIYIAYQAIQNILKPDDESPKPYTLVILLLVVGIKEIFSRRIHRVAEHTGSTAVKGDAGHRGAAFLDG